MTGVRAVTPTRMRRPEMNSELNTLTQLSDGPTMRPIRSQYPGHMITLDQSEATIRHVEKSTVRSEDDLFCICTASFEKKNSYSSTGMRFGAFSNKQRFRMK